MYSQLGPDTLWVLLPALLLLCVPAAHAAKCPQQCICDQIQLTVTCVSKNLTQVPPNVDEVFYSLKYTSISVVYLGPILFRLISHPVSL